MEGQGNPVAGCIIFLIFIIFNSIFYGFGSAIQHINENEVEKRAEEGDKKSRILLKMLSKPADLVNTIQVIATLLSILIGFSLIRSFSSYFSRLLSNTELAEQVGMPVLSVVVLIFIILLNLILLLSLGILVPKKGVCPLSSGKRLLSASGGKSSDHITASHIKTGIRYCKSYSARFRYGSLSSRR